MRERVGRALGRGQPPGIEIAANPWDCSFEKLCTDRLSCIDLAYLLIERATTNQLADVVRLVAPAIGAYQQLAGDVTRTPSARWVTRRPWTKRPSLFCRLGGRMRSLPSPKSPD